MARAAGILAKINRATGLLKKRIYAIRFSFAGSAAPRRIEREAEAEMGRKAFALGGETRPDFFVCIARNLLKSPDSKK
jgi:hypothetical protein